MTDTTYNGWANYETWAVGMYLDGNYDGPGTYYETIERTRGALGWDPPTQAQAPAAAAPPTSGGGGGGGNPFGNFGGSLTDPFTQTFTPPPPQTGTPSYVPQTPTYTAPTFTPPAYTPPPAFSYGDFQKPADFSYANFQAPNAQSVLNEPGYQFRLTQGEQSLQNAKAAQGLIGTGATLKAILGYGQDYAGGEYQNAYNRDLGTYSTNRGNAFGNYTTNYNNAVDAYNTNRGNAVSNYNTNYQTQYADPYKIAYQSATDSFAPQMAGFQANVNAGNQAYATQAAAGQHQNDLNYANAWNSYLFDYNRYRNQKLDTYNMQLPLVTA